MATKENSKKTSIGKRIAYIVMLIIAVLVYIFNKLAGTNYMFLNWPSEGSPLEWFAFLGRPGYLVGYLPLLAIAWTPIYLPGRLRTASRPSRI